MNRLEENREGPAYLKRGLEKLCSMVQCGKESRHLLSLNKNKLHVQQLHFPSSKTGEIIQVSVLGKRVGHSTGYLQFLKEITKWQINDRDICCHLKTAH